MLTFILIWLDADYIQELLIYNIQGKNIIPHLFNEVITFENSSIIPFSKSSKNFSLNVDKIRQEREFRI
jgi:hypothetical protein